MTHRRPREQQPLTTDGDRIIGVLQNNPVAGDTCTIAHGGVSKVVAGGTMSPRGDWRMPSDVAATAWLAEIERNVPTA